MARRSRPPTLSRSNLPNATDMPMAATFQLKMLRRAVPALAVLGFILGGCVASIPPQAAGSLAEPPKQKLAEATPPAVEREHQRILAAYGGPYEDDRLEGSVNQMVEKLVAASERPDLHYKVTILNSPAINAFALPTGQLYVTRGLIALANDSSELASVLSHEMAHVIARHADTREEEVKQAQLIDRVVNNLLTDSETGALALAKSKIKLASFSRQQEFEADGIGVEIAAHAGYDAYGAARFLTAMGRNADLKAARQSGAIDPRAPDFISSHPATPERVKNAQTTARQFAAPGGGGRDREDYLYGVDGMVYGEDPSEGFVRGRRFLHPKLGFTFVAPEGFILDNTAQAILGVKEGGGQALRLDAVRVPAEQALTDYLTSGWIENIDPKSVEPITISGFQGATATAKGDQWAFRLFAIRYGSDVYRFIFAAKQRTTEADRAFRESVSSFRRMSIAESNAAKPLRIHVVTAGPGDTIERLAARMPISDHPVERLRLLNGLGPTGVLRPGDQVKIITE